MVELADDRQHVRQLEGALDAGMAGENLLDQGRARTGQTDDEDRRRIGNPRSGPIREERGIEAVAHTARLVLEFFDAERRDAPAPGIADAVMLERLRISRLVFERPPERKVQLRLVRVVAPIARIKRPHRRDFGIAEHVVLEIGETPVGFCEPRVDVQALPIRLFAFPAPPECFLQVADRQAQPHFRGREPRRLAVGSERVLLTHQAGVHGPENHPVLRVLGLDLQQVKDRRFGLRQPARIEQRLAEAAPGERQVG